VIDFVNRFEKDAGAEPPNRLTLMLPAQSGI